METTFLKNDKEDIPPDFKLQWLNTTLKFIKDDTRLIYYYSEMPLSRAHYLHALILQRDNDLDFCVKSFFAPLWDVMRIFSNKYTYEVSVNILTKDTGRLKFVKVLKVEGEDESEEQSESGDESDTFSHRPAKYLTKSQKMTVQQRKLIERLSPAFIKCTLQSVLDFINDETTASVRFEDLAPTEAEFIENIHSIHLKKQKFYKLLSPASINILNKITNIFKIAEDKNKSFDLKICDQNINRKTLKRGVTIRKEPNFKKPSTNNRTNATMGAQVEIRPISSPVKVVKSAEHTPSDNGSSTKVTMETQVGMDIAVQPISSPMQVPTSTDHAVHDDGSKGKDTMETQFEKTSPVQPISSPTQMPNSADIAARDNGSRTKTNAKTPAELNSGSGATQKNKSKDPKQIIMDAMQVPLESDKGSRMMRLMGWEGGALGLRGDGITEPIMPSFHKPGIGLGHNSHNFKKNKRSKQCVDNKDGVVDGVVDKNHKTIVKLTAAMKSLPAYLSVQLLEGILDLLRTKHNIVYQIKLTPSLKQIRSLSLFVKDINLRKTISFDTPEGRGLMEEVMSKMFCDTEATIEFSYEKNCRLVTLSLKKLVPIVMKQKSPQIGKPNMKKQLDVVLEKIKHRIIETEGKIPDNSEKLLLKIYMLDKILDFVKSRAVQMKFDCFFGFQKKLFKYVRDICDAVNNGESFCEINSTEANIVRDIQRSRSADVVVEINKHILTFTKLFDVAKMKNENSPINLDLNEDQDRDLKLDTSNDCLTYLGDIVRDNDGNYDRNNQIQNINSSKHIDPKYDTSLKIHYATLTDFNKNIINPIDICNNKKISSDNTDNKLIRNVNKCDVDAGVIVKMYVDECADKTKDITKFLNEAVTRQIDNNNSIGNANQHSCCNKIDISLHSINDKSKREIIPIDNDSKKCTLNFISNEQVKIEFNKTSNIKIEKINSDLETSYKINKDIFENTKNVKIDLFDYKEKKLIKIYPHDDVENTIEHISENIQRHASHMGFRGNDLKCHGIQNGGLVYSCYDDSLKNILSEKFETCFYDEFIDDIKMKVEINCFLDIRDVLNNLMLCNIGLVTNDWKILKVTYKYFIVEMDPNSFEFISNKNFCLFAGIDTALFTVLL